MEGLEHVDIFSGVGGFALAAQWAGFQTVAFCEKDEYCQRVLEARFGAVVADANIPGLEKREGVDRDNGEEFAAAERNIGIPVIPDIRDFDGTRYRGAALLTGGFPCQPFSVAGKRGGTEDNRFLWPEMLRVIKEARPRWVVSENVAGLTSMGQQIGELRMDVRTITRDEDHDFYAAVFTRQERMLLNSFCEDFEKIGYEVIPVIVPASAVGADHRRYRVWIIAADGSNSSLMGLQGSDGRRAGPESENGYSRSEQDDPDSTNGRVRCGTASRQGGLGSCGRQNAPNAARLMLDGTGDAGAGRWGKSTDESWETPWSEVATRLCRISDGVPNRVDRLKALGNAIVPQVAYEIIEKIKLIEHWRIS